MTVFSMDMFEGEPKPATCNKCGRKIEKWINIVEIGDLCPVCAHYLMRILFQDIIEYHNGKGVSLVNIFYHGHFNGEKYNPGPSGKMYDEDICIHTQDNWKCEGREEEAREENRKKKIII